jgi:hypothetical protein
MSKQRVRTDECALRSACDEAVSSERRRSSDTAAHNFNAEPQGVPLSFLFCSE